MKFNGEHLLIGQFGHFLTILTLVASLIATIAYFKANKIIEIAEKQSWIKLARAAFFIETVSIIGIFGILLFLVGNHYHEYFFAWNHSSRSLQSRYLLSCIWEDQSGSFLLWAFWHTVLGWIIIWKNKQYEATVLTAINFAQFCIATMIIGIYFGTVKIGNNPFALLRHSLDAPMLFQNPDYLQFPKIHEGNDLNTLLQNYWMVIHPPVLFLGFASTVIPFAFAYSGLINKNHDWIKPALPWAGFSVAVLGTGIMMGAAWAYESLSFGGYWAWDPVENASLVPWIIMVAGLHVNLIYKSTGYSLLTTYLFYILSFILVLYSTFLTRSGILGDTSVHAFTGADMTLQLILFVLVFLIPVLYLYIRNYKSIPTIRKEEETYSREFWMFIGALVLVLSAVIIIAKTSLPVFNKAFGTKIATPDDVEFAYNQIQIFIAIILGIGSAITQYFKYKNTAAKEVRKKLMLPTIIALIIGICISVFGNIHYVKKGTPFLVAIHIGIFCAVYAVVANAGYIWMVLKGKIKVAGASVAHIGFGLVLLGILISSSKKTVLSWNTTGISLFKKDKQEDPAENITLFKGIATDMGKYMVTYVRDTFNVGERKQFFEVNFKAKKTDEQFNVYPDLISNNKGMSGFSANPDKKHYWYKDIFVYISAYPNKKDDTASFKNHTMKIGDTIFYSSGIMVLKNTEVNPEAFKKKVNANEVSVFLDVDVISKNGNRYKAHPGLAIAKDVIRNLPDTIAQESVEIRFNKVLDKTKGELEIAVKESSVLSDVITLKVYEFPMINILWIGIIIMVFGTGMSIRQRLR